jgi:hypothetical protein
MIFSLNSWWHSAVWVLQRMPGGMGLSMTSWDPSNLPPGVCVVMPMLMITCEKPV